MSVNDVSIRAGCQIKIENVNLESRHLELIEMLNDMPCQDDTTEANEEIEMLVNSFVYPELNTCVGISTREEDIGRMADTKIRADDREETSICQDESRHSGCPLNIDEALMPNIRADYQKEIENVTFEIPWNGSLDVSSSSTKSITENVCYQPDSSGLFQEVSQDSDIVEKRDIWLPVTIVKPSASIKYSKSMVDAELQESYVRPSELIPIEGTDDDLIPALDQLAVLLGEPPRKKTVWDQFDLITKNLPFAQHLEENDFIKSAGTGSTLDKTILHGCKRNTQKKIGTKNVRFGMPGKPHLLPSRYCTSKSLRKGTAKTMTVGRPLNFELKKRPYEKRAKGKCLQAVVRSSLSNKSVPNNIGKIIDSGNNNMKIKVSECTKTQNSDENKSTNTLKKLTSKFNTSGLKILSLI